MAIGGQSHWVDFDLSGILVLEDAVEVNEGISSLRLRLLSL